MNKRLVYLGMITLSLFFTACSEDTPSQNDVSSADNTSSVQEQASVKNKSQAIIMKQNINYKIEKGKMIVPLSTEPNIEIETDIKTGETVAKLIEGEAKIVSE